MRFTPVGVMVALLEMSGPPGEVFPATMLFVSVSVPLTAVAESREKVESVRDATPLM